MKQANEARRQEFIREFEAKSHSADQAAQAALDRLERAGFPGAIHRPDSKRRMRAAWHLGSFSCNRPHGEVADVTFHLLSTGELDPPIHSCRETPNVIAAMDRLGR